jgi:hypothetical protein
VRYAGRHCLQNLQNLVLEVFNNYTGGSGFNYVYFYSGGNTYKAQAGSLNDVFEVGGTDTIDKPDGAGVTAYVYS